LKNIILYFKSHFITFSLFSQISAFNSQIFILYIQPTYETFSISVQISTKD